MEFEERFQYYNEEEEKECQVLAVLDNIRCSYCYKLDFDHKNYAVLKLVVLGVLAEVFSCSHCFTSFLQPDESHAKWNKTNTYYLLTGRQLEINVSKYIDKQIEKEKY